MTFSEKPIQLISDLAVAESINSRQDALEFSSYANVIARIARGTRGPFTIGVFGEWGMGKTSLMRLVEQEITKNNTKNSIIIPVWFNAWMFERVEYPVIPLLKGIIEALRKEEGVRDKLKPSIGVLIDSLEALVVAFKLKGKLSLPGGSIEAEFDPAKTEEAFSRFRRRRNTTLENTDSYEKIFEALHKISDKAVPRDITVMVLIDDLDRCFPENAVRLLESIKLILSQPGFLFVLGASRVVIEEYLQSKYENQYGIKHFDGRAYLDKMIQLTFDIPPHASRIDSFTKEIINGLQDKNTRNELRPISTIIGETCQYNPRTIIRFINRLITDSAIYKQKNASVARATLPVGIFAVTRSLQQTWRDVYGLLVSGDTQEDREYCEIVAKWNDEDVINWSNYDPQNSNTFLSNGIQDVINHLQEADPGALKQIASYISHDRTLRSLLQQKIGFQWLTNHSLREASVSFLMTQPVENVLDLDNEFTTVSESRVKRNMYFHDDMYKDAVMIVIELQRASTSLLQRRLRVGYARAARIIEQMEKEGIIAQADGSRPRDVLVNNLEEAESIWLKNSAADGKAELYERNDTIK